MIEVDKINLCVGAPGIIGRPKSLVDFHDGSIHGNLLNDLTGNIDIILGQQQEHLLGEKLLQMDEHHIDRRRRLSNLREAMLHETMANVGREVAPQRFLAGYKGKTTGQFLSREVSGLSDLILAGIRDEILRNEFPRRDTSDCNRSFYHRQYNLRRWTLEISVPKTR